MRRRNCRFVRSDIPESTFACSSESSSFVEISHDEVEALRLAGCNMLQIEASKMMGISRTTFDRILTSACKKVADAFLHRKSITISSSSNNILLDNKEEKMENVIAVPVEESNENPRISGHFGRSPFFAIVNLGDNSKEIIGFVHVSCTDISDLLHSKQVKAVLVKGIGPRPKESLAELGIKVVLAEGETLNETISQYKSGKQITFEGSCSHHHGENENCGHHQHHHGHND